MADREPFQIRTVQEDPAKVAAREKAAAAGRRKLRTLRWTSLVWPKHRTELRALVAKSVDRGLWWGTGTLLRHIAIDMFTPFGLCLTPLGGTTSSDPDVGLLCPRCVKLRKRGLRDTAVDDEATW